jgi:hypothetical protein
MVTPFETARLLCDLSSDVGTEFIVEWFSTPKINQCFHTRSPVTMIDIDGWHVRDVITPIFFDDNTDFHYLIRKRLILPYYTGSFHPSFIEEYADGLLMTVVWLFRNKTVVFEVRLHITLQKQEGGLHPILCDMIFRTDPIMVMTPACSPPSNSWMNLTTLLADCRLSRGLVFAHNRHGLSLSPPLMGSDSTNKTFANAGRKQRQKNTKRKKLRKILQRWSLTIAKIQESLRTCSRWPSPGGSRLTQIYGLT